MTPSADRPSCRQLELDWEPNRDGARYVANIDTGYHDGERGIFVFRRPNPLSSDPRSWWTVIATDAGDILAVFDHAFPEDVGCYLGRVAIGEGRFAVEVPRGDLSSWVVGGEIGAPAATVRNIAHMDGTTLEGGFISFVRVGAEQIAVQTTGSHVLRVGWDGSVRRVDQGGIVVDGESPSVVGSAIVFDSFQARNHIMLSDGGAAPVDLVPPPESGAEPSIHDRTDGRTLAWLVGFNRSGGSPLFFDRVELWGSPFSPRPADLRPVRLADMRNTSVHTGVIGGHGHAAVVDDDASAIRFFRLADAHETEVVAPPGLQWSGWVSFVGPREIMVSAGTSAAFAGQTMVQLIDYAALEPPM